MLLYTLVIGGLIVLNFARLYMAQGPSAPPIMQDPVAAITAPPSLEMQPECGGDAAPPTRDLFRKAQVRAPVQPAPVVETAAPAKPDTKALARELAARKFSEMRLIGVMGSSDNMLAVLEYDGQISNLTEGVDIIPGYRIRRISIDEVEIENELIGITGILSVDKTTPARITGISE